jgi:hypothetical protein
MYRCAVPVQGGEWSCIGVLYRYRLSAFLFILDFGTVATVRYFVSLVFFDTIIISIKNTI